LKAPALIIADRYEMLAPAAAALAFEFRLPTLKAAPLLYAAQV
jgi:hypothetical protein